MLQLSTFPGWEGMHPLLIYFPLTLIFLAAVFALMASCSRAMIRPAFLTSALMVMIFGTILTYIVYETAEAAATADLSPEAKATMESHREFAGLARSSLTAATLLFGIILAICTFLHLRMRELISILPVGAAVFYVLGLFWLIHAAYQGERLIHEFGVGTW